MCPNFGQQKTRLPAGYFIQSACNAGRSEEIDMSESLTDRPEKSTGIDRQAGATLQDAVAALTRLGCKPTRSGDGYTAFCPIHEADGQGHKPSLNLKAGDTQAVVVRCHAGCDWKEILKALDITPAPSHNGKRRIVATYSYRDLDGREAFQKIRYEPKDFRQRWPDGQAAGCGNAQATPLIFYTACQNFAPRLPRADGFHLRGRKGHR